MLKKILVIKLTTLILLFFIFAFQSCQKMEVPELPNSKASLSNFQLPEGVSNNSDVLMSNKLLSYHDFESGIGNWNEKSTMEPWSAFSHQNYARAGKSALRFELRSTDSKLGYRIELGQKPSTEREAWYGFSNLFPKEFIEDALGENILQFQSAPDAAKGESWRSAPLILLVINDRFALDMRTDANEVTKGELKMTRLDLGPVEKETWNDWVFHMKWAWDNTGILEIWKNNKLIVSRKNMPNCYNDVTFPYLRFGIIKYAWANKSEAKVQKRVYYIDEIKFGNGNSSYSKVYPGGSTSNLIAPTVIETEDVNYYDFNNTMGLWNEKSFTDTWSANLVKNISRKGNGSLKFELRKNDSKLGYRTELGQKPSSQKEGWYGFSNYFPKDYLSDPIIESILQFQSAPDLSKGEDWRSPPILLGIQDDRFALSIRFDPNPVSKGEIPIEKIDLGPVDKGVWIDWVFHIKWAWDNTGILEVWKNNQLVCSRKNLPNCYNDLTYPYLKIGLYKWDWAKRFTPNVQSRYYYVDEVTLGTASSGYAKVYPGR